jgi:hypothetical protein
MSGQNVLISETGEVISTRMARHIIQLALEGCTEQCIPCHFKEVWHREIDQQSVFAFLEQDIEVTDRPGTHGETLLADGRTMVPNGIVSEMFRLAELAGSEFIAIYLTLRYPALQRTFTEAMVDMVLMEMDELWITEADGNATLDPLAPRRHEPSGHRIGSLPTIPVTPRNGGRPRSSHRNPPPAYSPGRPEWHHQQVLAPLALLERPRLPPTAYPDPPSYVAQDPPLWADEFMDSSNGAIISASEFLATLEYSLQPLDYTYSAVHISLRYGPTDSDEDSDFDSSSSLFLDSDDHTTDGGRPGSIASPDSFANYRARQREARRRRL